MRYRQFGNTDLNVSEIGFGAWAIGGNAMAGNTPIGWGPADDATSKKAIHAALDAGINFFDTADVYGLGHSEELLGNVLEKGEAIIATKVGNVVRDEKFTTDYTRAYILEACTQSLKRLQRDHIDYYQLHSARLSHLADGDCIQAMQQLQQEGKIRYWGISLNTFHPGPEADFFLENGIGNGFQIAFNIINQKALDLIKLAAAKGYGIIARMPLQFGLLTGKFDENTHFSKDDHRHFRLTPEALANALSILRNEVWPLGEKEGIAKTSLALSFIAGIEAISTIIPGIRTPEHVAQNTADIKTLSPETMEALFSLGKKEMQPLMQLMEQIG
jgi:aryl-alcohol dehydrogenase-like predicted oxidoreductase